ncbi:tyrosine recombinase XerC [Dehalococcoides mccartyi]|uniref:Tyrosine recombinase XerC n=1 Tax=Dehalococcoides mccartyi (strain ATCC BAA-2266 / KCTC 15142 / 195) TaxID=243164 RepID=Q3Z8J2_DEHM1|nr:tyrosine recombinase XerC [Dehalococcoides mccartyi]AAW39973.1 tyrosine recombinase XerC [Dehalococcoides mccartyi 195]MDN4185743.1 tyrosine recombinase XerC [Dehalococcoides mccartyi]
MQENFNKYLEYLTVEKNVSAYTLRNYRTDLIGFVNYLIEKKVSSFDKVDRYILRDYMSSLIEKGIVKGSIARKLSAVRSFYRYLMREGLIQKNPTLNASSPRLDKRLPEFLTTAEVNKLLRIPDSSTPQGLRDKAFMELLYASGLRVSELVKLDIENLDLHSHQIRVWGKGSKERIVLMGLPAIQSIQTYLNLGRPLLKGKRNTPALFLNPNGGRLSARSFQERLDKLAHQAGIEKHVHPHMLRHTFATHLLDGGADLRVVQELLGHSNLSTTQIYTHVTKSQARKVYMSSHPLAKPQNDISGSEDE